MTEHGAASSTPVETSENEPPGETASAAELSSLGRRYLYAIAFLVGVVVMAAEVSAGRLVAPYFGTSSPVWALIIGAVLASLAAGQLLGGWLSRRRRPIRIVAGLLLVSAVLTAFLPTIGRGILGGGIELVRAGAMAPIVAAGIGITMILALPMLALGAIGPLLLHQAVERRDEAGPVAGRIYALGSIGSLIGTYSAGLLLVPWLGVSRTLWLCAAVLAAAGLLGSRLKVMTAAAATVLLVNLALVAASVEPAPPGGPGQTLLHHVESTLNHVRVVEEKRALRLYLNDGYAVQSEYPADGSLPLYDVWLWYAAAPVFTATGRPKSALLLGLGGGTSARMLQEIFPEASVTGVELDPAVVEAGRRFMGLSDDVEVVIDDARAFVGRDDRRFDVIILDAFDFPYVPFQLVTKEFFEALEARLEDGGVLMVNVGRYGRRYDVVDAVARTLAEVYPTVRGADVDNESNTMLVAGRHDPSLDVGADGLGLDRKVAARMRQIERIATWSPAEGSPVLTDDRAPVELLTDRIVLRSLLGGG